MTSSSAASRGMTFLVLAVAGATIVLWVLGEPHQQGRERFGEVVVERTAFGHVDLADATEPGRGLGGLGRPMEPATRTCTSSPIASAAVRARAVTSFSAPDFCSANSNTVIGSLPLRAACPRVHPRRRP